MLIKVNDVVVMLSGRDKGQKGRVIKVDRAENTVVVENLNKIFKHVKRSQRNPQGGDSQRNRQWMFRRWLWFVLKPESRLESVFDTFQTAPKNDTAKRVERRLVLSLRRVRRTHKSLNSFGRSLEDTSPLAQ